MNDFHKVMRLLEFLDFKSELKENFIIMFSESKRIIFIFLLTAYGVNCAKITMEQMQQASDPIRLVCIQKSKVTEDVLLNMRAGKLDDIKELKCYVNCVLEMMQVVRKTLR